MRDLTSRGISAVPSRPPKGIAFEIADLVLIRSWAAFHGLGMSVRLDQGAQGEEYEELIAFRAENDPLSGVAIWRNAEAVFVHPPIGRRRQYNSIAEALEDLRPERRIELTDIRTSTGHVPPFSGTHLRAQAAHYWDRAATEVTATIRLSLLRLAERCESLALSIDEVERGC